MATALTIIESALRRVQSYQSGESVGSPDQADCLEALNDLLDSWSTDKLFIFGSNENILQWVSGQNQYTIGNPMCSDLGESPFIGTLTGASDTISSITNIPSDLKIGATLTDSSAVIPSGTVVTAIGASSVTMSNEATASPSGASNITYTIPGDFAIPRPLRITGAYTRFNNLDFTMDVYTTQDEYNSILYKQQNGPWPTVCWYNAQYPYGILNIYQTPGNGAELHLFTDTILQNLAITDTFILPQGYARALKWNLARELWIEYCSPVIPQGIEKMAAESLSMIRALNAQPAMRSMYDRALTRGNRPDGGWILHGGYGR